MRAAVISLGSTSSKMLMEKLENYFDEVVDINIKDCEIRLGRNQFDILYRGEPLDKFDALYPKGSFRYVELLRSIATIVEKKAYIPFKPESFTICHDKLLTHLKLQEHNVMNPQTLLFSSVDAAKAVLQSMFFPIIMKLPHGTHGKGVMFADSPEAASSMLDTLAALKQPFIIQEYIETGGSDLRALVVGDEVVACMQRSAVSGEKRANIHAGGKGIKVELDAKGKKMAIDAAHAVGCEICAIDLLKGPKGYTVIEVNISPGLQGITSTTGIDVADEMAKFLHRKAKERKSKKKDKKETRAMAELGLDKNKGKKTQIVDNPDFRGERLLLPAVVTKLSKFKPKEDLSFQAKEGEIVVKRLE